MEKTVDTKNKKVKKRVLGVLFFFLCEGVFVSILSICLIFYGPLTHIRDIYVTSAMKSMSHHYFATIFLSQKTVDEIMAKNVEVIKNVEQKSNTITIKKENDKGIEIIDINKSHFKGKIMIVNDPKRVVVGSAPNLSKSGATLSEMVKNYGAIGGINAGGFIYGDDAGVGGLPTGIVVEKGQVVYTEKGFTHFRVVGIDDQGVLIINNSMTVDAIKKSKIQYAISFGPSLIMNGVGLVTSGGIDLAPRTAIGQKRDGSIMLVVIDGRQASSLGATMMDMQNLMMEYGAYNATNLDGGYSTAMVYQNKIVNSPSNIWGERSIPTGFLVTS